MAIGKMIKTSDDLAKLVQFVGGQAALERASGVTAQYIGRLVKGERPLSVSNQMTFSRVAREVGYEFDK